MVSCDLVFDEDHMLKAALAKSKAQNSNDTPVEERTWVVVEIQLKRWQILRALLLDEASG